MRGVFLYNEWNVCKEKKLRFINVGTWTLVVVVEEVDKDIYRNTTLYSITENQTITLPQVDLLVNNQRKLIPQFASLAP